MAHASSRGRRPIGIESVPELAGKDKAQNGELYNGMVHPSPRCISRRHLVSGGRNVGDGMLYYHRMRAPCQRLAKGLASRRFPFYYVQLTPLNWGGKPKEQHAELWEAQSAALQIANTGMVVTNDIGNIGDAHPPKSRRLAALSLWALAKTYGKKDIIYSGPVYQSMKVEGNKIRVQFDHVHGGLASRDGKPLSWFTIAGEDGKFVPALWRSTAQACWCPPRRCSSRSRCVSPGSKPPSRT